MLFKSIGPVALVKVAIGVANLMSRANVLLTRRSVASVKVITISKQFVILKVQAKKWQAPSRSHNSRGTDDHPRGATGETVASSTRRSNKVPPSRKNAAQAGIWYHIKGGPKRKRGTWYGKNSMQSISWSFQHHYQITQKKQVHFTTNRFSCFAVQSITALSSTSSDSRNNKHTLTLTQTTGLGSLPMLLSKCQAKLAN